MAGTSRVSVIIVNYRSYPELDACLASLRDHGGASLEVTVVDNASVADALDAVSRCHPGARLLPRSDNPGFAAAVDEGARQTSGDYLLLLNPDCAVLPDAVGTLARYLDEHPRVAAVGPRVYDPDGQVQRSARGRPGPLTALFGRTSLASRLWPDNPISRRNLPADHRTTLPLEVDWIAGSCLMIRAAAFHAVGGFDERFFLYWEDADLCRRLRETGWLVVHLPSAGVVHQCGRSSRHRPARSIVAFHRSAFRYYAKHARGPARYPLLALAAVGLGARMGIMLLVASLRGARRTPHVRSSHAESHVSDRLG
jgi:GT2 family glycosyltransferase